MGASTLNKKELFRLHIREVKDDYATLMGDCEYYESQIENLQDENDRLRKMCTDMLMCINAREARKSICWECEHHRDVDELRSACFLGLDARKLGIEAK